MDELTDHPTEEKRYRHDKEMLVSLSSEWDQQTIEQQLEQHRDQFIH